MATSCVIYKAGIVSKSDSWPDAPVPLSQAGNITQVSPWGQVSEKSGGSECVLVEESMCTPAQEPAKGNCGVPPHVHQLALTRRRTAPNDTQSIMYDARSQIWKNHILLLIPSEEGTNLL